MGRVVKGGHGGEGRTSGLILGCSESEVKEHGEVRSRRGQEARMRREDGRCGVGGGVQAAMPLRKQLPFQGRAR